MRLSLSLFAVTVASFVCFLSVSQAQGLSAKDRQGIQRAEAIIKKLPKRARVAVWVEKLSGASLFKNLETKPMRPASNMKVLSLGLALDKLGADYKFRTSLRAGAPIQNSRIAGSVYVIGRGDPSLSRRFQDPKDGSFDIPVLNDWARRLVRRGVRFIDGDIVADDRFFSAERFHPDWDKREAHKWYASEVSALNLNDNCVDIEVLPAAGGARFQLYPPTQFLTMVNQCQATSKARAHVFSIGRAASSNTVTIRGKIFSQSKGSRTEVAVTNPSLYFVTALKESLTRAGIKVGGQARRMRSSEVVPKGELLAEEVTPLPLILSICGKRSLNLYAESLLRTVARENLGEGSWAKGQASLKTWLGSLGLTASGLVLRDGSGLSRKNQLTAATLAGVLRHMLKDKTRSVFRSSLATGGIDGTLRRRFKALPAGVRVEAKTGTLRDTSSLSGYLWRPKSLGGPLIFVILTENTPGARSIQEKLVRGFFE